MMHDGGEPNHKQLPTCPKTGKLMHDTEGQAAKAAKRLGHITYLCPFCHGWHTADDPEKKERRRVRYRHRPRRQKGGRL